MEVGKKTPKWTVFCPCRQLESIHDSPDKLWWCLHSISQAGSGQSMDFPGQWVSTSVFVLHGRESPIAKRSLSFCTSNLMYWTTGQGRTHLSSLCCQGHDHVLRSVAAVGTECSSSCQTSLFSNVTHLRAHVSCSSASLGLPSFLVWRAWALSSVEHLLKILSIPLVTTHPETPAHHILHPLAWMPQHTSQT